MSLCFIVKSRETSLWFIYEKKNELWKRITNRSTIILVPCTETFNLIRFIKIQLIFRPPKSLTADLLLRVGVRRHPKIFSRTAGTIFTNFVGKENRNCKFNISPQGEIIWGIHETTWVFSNDNQGKVYQIKTVNFMIPGQEFFVCLFFC